MKPIPHKIIAAFLSLVVLISTSSFTISKHYCLGKLVETTVFIKNDGCKPKTIDKKSVSCDMLKSFSCCDDKHLVFEGLDDIQFESYSFDIEINYFSLNNHYTFFEDAIIIEKSQFLYYNYKPPPLIKPIYQFDESYLI